MMPSLWTLHPPPQKKTQANQSPRGIIWSAVPLPLVPQGRAWPTNLWYPVNCTQKLFYPINNTKIAIIEKLQGTKWRIHWQEIFHKPWYTILTKPHDAYVIHHKFLPITAFSVAFLMMLQIAIPRLLKFCRRFLISNSLHFRIYLHICWHCMIPRTPICS